MGINYPDIKFDRRLSRVFNWQFGTWLAEESVIVEPPEWPLWLGETEGDAASLLHPAAEDTLRVWPVSARVNRPANNDAELLAPLPAA
jgi:putative SOS response-associated peptidase YedK